MGFHINGARVVDKSRSNYPMYKIELWLDSSDMAVKEKIKMRLEETMTHGLPPHKVSRNNPKFEWKGHS